MNNFRESGRVAIAGHEKLATRDVMMRSLLSSMVIGGGQVRCVGIVPGVTMRVSTGDLQPQSAEQAHSFATEIWEKYSPVRVLPYGRFWCTPIDSTTTRSVTLASMSALPTQGYNEHLLDGISPPDAEGFRLSHRSFV
ncbi:MAG TPA: hypothetical protein VF446_07920 [Trinickia sp.]